MSRLSRRRLLKLTAAAAVASPIFCVRRAWGASGFDPIAPEPPPAPLGRVTNETLKMRALPTTQSGIVTQLIRDQVLLLDSQVVGQEVFEGNPLWYGTREGFVYSAYVQPIEPVLNDPDPDAARRRYWAEVTVPFTDARATPDPAARAVERFYFTCAFRVVGAQQDSGGGWWYRVQEGWGYVPGPWVRAEHLRFFPPEDLTPISPDMRDKRIFVDLTEQTMTCFEEGRGVLTCKVSSGYGDFGTPVGRHRVLFKVPAQRMKGGTGNDAYNLPGVAFPTYLTWSGVAVHSAYWHNDFGRRRSHGCLNVPADVARWVWRWTSPAAPYTSAIYYTPAGAQGTVVEVVG